jgi:two-component system sensor histidine kinase KdpD
VITTLDPHPARGLLRLCRDHNVTQIVMGKSRRSWWKKLFDKTPTDELLKESYPVDIYIVSGERGGAPSVKERLPVPRSPQGRLPELGWMLVLVAATAFLADPLVPILGYRSIGLVFLLPVLALSLFARPKVIWAGTVLSTLVWDYFFIPPFHTLSLQHEQDYVMLALFLAVATVTGTLTSKLRRQRGVLETRERRASLLYRLSKALAAAASAQDVLDTARRELGELLGESVLLLPRAGEGLSPSPRLDPKERAVAEWVLKNDKPAGRFTDTLPAAEGSYFPLFTRQASEGVMGLLPARRRLTPELRILLEAVCGQLGLALQKERLGEQARAAELARESDRLSRSLLNVVSHELKTPLTALLSAASSLEARAAEGSEREGELLRSVGENGRRLARIVDHLLEANRMEAGKIEVRRDPVDLRDVLDATLRRLGPEMAGRPVNIRAPEGTLLVETDEVLLGTVLRNLVHNALFHTPPGTPVHLQVRVQDGRVLINVRDEGPGLPPGNEEKIFEKFYRGPQATPGGSGLGLALARGLAEALGGTLTATSTEPRGADFALSLPFRRPA